MICFELFDPLRPIGRPVVSLSVMARQGQQPSPRGNQSLPESHRIGRIQRFE
jgi:hypothetical protein